MPELIPVGTLVRVLPEALTGTHKHVNNRLVETHGWLYIITGWREKYRNYACRSLATGRSGDCTVTGYNLCWFPHEIEEAPTDDEA